MDAVPPHTENKVEDGRPELSPPTASLPEATADSRGIDSNRLSRRGKAKILSIPQWGNEYGIAVGATLLAFLLRWSIDSYLEDRLAYAAFLVAIAVTTWHGGIGPSLLTVALGGLIGNWVFVHPRHAFSVADLDDQAEIAVYVTVSFALVGFAQTWRWAWKRTEEMTSELRMEMDRNRRTEETLAHVESMGSTSASKYERRL